jgi:alpha-beta hydrolase superfamily lysophospholipase
MTATLRSGADDNGVITGKPFWLSTGPEPIYGVLHTPPPGERARVAALILPAFGWDNDSSYRQRRDWATALAAAGVIAARIDFPGTEDSVGSPLSPGRVRSWLDATGSASNWLRQLSGCERLVVVGIGLGGLIACQAAAEDAAIDDLVLWGVRAGGRAYMRELRAYAAVVAGEIGDTEVRADGAIGIGGHAMSSETADALSAINLTEIELPQARLRRVLLIGRDDHGVDEKLRRHLEESGAAVTVLEADDYHCLMTTPELALTPTKTISASIEWLLDGSASELGCIGHVPTAEIPTVLDSVEFECDGAAIRERIVELPTPAGRLVGIISERADGARAPYCLVTLNTAALRHTGPNRIFVEIARRAAAIGVPTARFDLPGFGDSDGKAARTIERTAESDAGSFAALRAIYDHLEQLGVANRFVTSGICIGGYLASRAVLADTRVIGSITVNVSAFKWGRLQREQQRRWARWVIGQEVVVNEQVRLRMPPPIRKIVDRLVHIRYVMEYSARTRLVGFDLLWGIAYRREIAKIAKALDELGDTGARAFLMFTEEEVILRFLAQPRVAARLQRWRNLDVTMLPSRDHMVRPLWLQELLFDRVCLLLRELRLTAELTGALERPARHDADSSRP